MVTRSPSFSKSDRPADPGFGRNVADDQAVRAAGEAAVGDQADAFAQALADERAGDREHLAHPRSAHRAFAADDHHVARLNLPRLDRGEAGFFAVEDLGRAGDASPVSVPPLWPPLLPGPGCRAG